jgi:Holliday junction DNA helicase RuvB
MNKLSNHQINYILSLADSTLILGQRNGEWCAHGPILEQDIAITNIALEALHVDAYGLDEMDTRILLAIIDKFKGGPVGLSTIATAIGENAGTLEEVYEPFLIQEGFLKRTPRGREVTEKAFKHLGKLPPSHTGSLF